MLVNVGKNIEQEVDFAKLPANVQEHVVYIGLRNILMDSHASITTEKSENVEADSRAMVEKKLAAMLAGEVRSVGTRTGDAVKSEAIRLATTTIKNAARKAGKKLADIEAKALREAAVKLVDSNPVYMTQARKNIDEAKALAPDGVDVGALFT